MKVIIQVVKEARVKVQKEEISRIGKGYLLYVGIEEGDQEEVVKKMAERIVNIRINKDERGKINKGIKEEGGEMLSVPQFTLCAETKKRRPSFTRCAKEEEARRLYEAFNEEIRGLGIEVKEGKFKAEMEVESINRGPFTIIMTENAKKG